MKNKAKVLLVSFSSEINVELAKKLKENSVEIIYWIGHGQYFEEILKNRKKFPDTIFHHAFVHDILRAVAVEEVGAGDFSPVDSQLVNKLLEYESQFWMMVDRFEDRKELSSRQIKHQYYEYIKYWHGVLKKLKPDFVIFGTDVPHTAFNLVIYGLAKILNVKTVIYKKINGIQPERLIFTVDYKNYTELREEYHKLRGSSFALNDLSDTMKHFYLRHNDPSVDNTPSYADKSSLQYEYGKSRILPLPRSIIKNVINFQLFKKIILYVKFLFIKRRVFGIGKKIYYSNWQLKIKQYWKNKENKLYKENYQRLQSYMDWDKKFIYVALHYQPELSTNPTGGIYDDQIVMIDNLSSALPANWVIYVKENTMQWARPKSNVGRYDNYYQQIAKIKNVYLISPEILTFDLINRSQAVATVTGTVAFEAILRSKPALVFGYSWFMDCEGIFKVDDLNLCRQALSAIEHGYLPDRKKIIQFLGAVERVAVKGYLVGRFKKGADVSKEECVQNIFEKLISILDKN